MTPTVPTFLGPLLAQPVAILGDGLSGRAALGLVQRLGGTGRIFDARGVAGAPADFGPAEAQTARLVVFSPGFSPGHPWLALAHAAGAVCLGELDFASLLWRGSVVAVTGTNGKTTLTEFLTHALRAAGRDAHATGNIGFPFSQLVAEQGGGAPDSVAVCEVSSFQAETLRHFRADTALWTNFAEDHLERHRSLEAYFLAKWRLFERTVGGHVLAGSGVQRAVAAYGQSLPAEALVPSENQPGDVLLRGTVFADYPQRENFILAAAWWRGAGLPETTLYGAARTFRLGPHRLARVGEHAGVTYWNDSKATNFHAVEAALASFAAPVVLIAGGKSKGGDLAGFVRRIAPRVRHVCLIGETAPALAACCRWESLAHSACADLAAAVGEAGARAQPGEQVLLSPGFASFDQFRGYEDRGRQFVTLVNALDAAGALA